MNSDEERLEEMLRAVMETESAIAEEEGDSSDLTDGLPDISLNETTDNPSDLPSDEEREDTAEAPEEISFGGQSELPDLPIDELPEEQLKMPFDEEAEEQPDFSEEDIPDEAAAPAIEAPSDALSDKVTEQSADLPSDEIPERLSGKNHEPTEEELGVNPLELLAMSEDEIDQVLEKEAALGEMFSGKKEAGMSESEEPEKPSNVEDDLSDIEALLQMADNHEQVEESAPKTGRKLPDIPDEPEEEPEETGKSAGKKKKEKKKDKKKERKKETDGEAKEGFGKKFASVFFGSDEDELEEEQAAAADGKKETAAEEKKAAKEKKKKEKKPKKSKDDPKKAEKEKQKKAKNAEKAKKRAEKAQKAEAAAKEKRAEKKLPKKKVFVWIVLCASIGAGILLLNTIGISTLQLTEARNSFDNKDFETAYRLLNGKELSEEDQLLFVQASAILHIQHAEEVYEIHLKLEKLARALDDLLRGVDKYQELLRSGKNDAITPEATAHYQNILKLLQENYGLSEEGALEINAIEGDYEYSLQIEAIVNGEIYQSQAEFEEQPEEEAVQYPELTDMLPEEEEFFIEDMLPEDEEFFMEDMLSEEEEFLDDSGD